MQKGMKLGVEDWVRILDQMELDLGPYADKGYRNLETFLREGWSIDHVLWRDKLQTCAGTKGFTFVLKDSQMEEKKCEVIYGPRSALYMTENQGRYDLYFGMKPPLETRTERSQEEIYSPFQEQDWKAGL